MKIASIEDIHLGDIINVDGKYANAEYDGPIRGAVVEITPTEIHVHSEGSGLVKIEKSALDVSKVDLEKYIKGDRDRTFLAGGGVSSGLEKDLDEALYL